jgi:hypothetical protein
MLGLFQVLCLNATALAQSDDHGDSGPLQVGYAVITPTSGTANGMIVFETFGLRAGSQTLQAGIVPVQATTNALVFVNTSPGLSRDVGIAMLNPEGVQVQVNMTLRREDGLQVGTKIVFIPPRQQISLFASQLFADVPTVPKELTGALSITSDSPVLIAVLRFRGSNFSTLPVNNLTPSSSIPVIAPGVGGPGSVILPHFASGSGWASEIVITNNSSSNLGVRVDLFKQDGSPLSSRLNHQSGNTFVNPLIFPGAAFTLAPRDTNGNSRF